MSASLVTDASDVIRDSVRDWNQYTLTGGSGAVLVTTVILVGAGAQRRVAVGFIYTLIVCQAGEVVSVVGQVNQSGGSNLPMNAGREVLGVVVSVVLVGGTPVETKSLEA